jgi:hypothetical protein
MTAVPGISTGTTSSRSGNVVPRASWIWFVVLGAITVLLSTLGQFTSSVSPLQEVRDDDWLVATFGAGMGLLTIVIAATAYRRGERWAAWAFTYYLLFFAVHIAVFGTWIPDAVLLLLTVAALVLGLRRPVTTRTE